MTAVVHKIARGFAVSISMLANEFNVTRETVAKRINRAGLEPHGEAKGHPTYRLRDAVKAILGLSVEQKEFATGGDGKDCDPRDLPPNERLAWMRSETEFLKVSAARRELIPAAVFEAELSKAFKLVAQTLDTLMDRLERDCGLSPEAIERGQVVIETVRAELFASVTDSEPSEE